MATKLDTSVYVDFGALNTWKNQMGEINDLALENLDSFISKVEELQNSWCGNASEGFLKSSKTLIDKAKSYHNEMKDVQNFLIKVVNTMDKQ